MARRITKEKISSIVGSLSRNRNFFYARAKVKAFDYPKEIQNDQKRSFVYKRILETLVPKATEEYSG